MLIGGISHYSKVGIFFKIFVSQKTSLIGGISFMMLKVVNTTVPKTTLFFNFIPLQPLWLFIMTLLVSQSDLKIHSEDPKK